MADLNFSSRYIFVLLYALKWYEYVVINQFFEFFHVKMKSLVMYLCMD